MHALPIRGSGNDGPYEDGEFDSTSGIGPKRAIQRIERAGQSVTRIKPMFRAEIQWLASGPTLKLEGKLFADWAEQARRLVTKDVLPEDLIVDLTEVTYVDSVGEQFLKWLAGVGAVFIAGSVYAFVVCDRLRLPPMQEIAERRKRRHGSSG